MTFLNETLHPLRTDSVNAVLKKTLFSLGISLCLGVSMPSLSMASSDGLSELISEEKKETPQHLHGYTQEVHDFLLKKSSLFLNHDTISTQLHNKAQGDNFLHDIAKKAYDLIWELVIAQQGQFSMDSGLFLFDATVNKKSVTELEKLTEDELNNIKTKDVALPRSDKELPVTNKVTTSLAGIEERLLIDLARFIQGKIAQNKTNPLENVEIKDLKESFIHYTKDTNQDLSKDITQLLQSETYNTLYLLMCQRALLEILESDVNESVQNNNALIESYKALLGSKEKFDKAQNTKNEKTKHEQNLLKKKQSIETLLIKRTTLQKTFRDKMIEFANILKAPGESTSNLEQAIYGAWPVDGDTSYSGYFSFPSITSYRLSDTLSYNLFGARHSRSIKAESIVNPLIKLSHAQNVFASFQKHVVKQDANLEALLMGSEVKSFLEQSNLNLYFDTLFNDAPSQKKKEMLTEKGGVEEDVSDSKDATSNVNHDPMSKAAQAVNDSIERAQKDMEERLKNL